MKYLKKSDMQITRLIIPAMALAWLLISCNLINPPEDIPSILQMDTAVVKVSNFDQGSATHNLTCVKVYLAGTGLGIFRLPAAVPTLTTGNQDLRLDPVIDLNGISGSREVYPFFKPFVASNLPGSNIKQINFVAGQTYVINPVYTYKDEALFVWMEDFEDAGISFEYPSYSDTAFYTRRDSVCTGQYSGCISLDGTRRYFEGCCSYDLELPKTGAPVLLEFDYISFSLVEVGMYAIEDPSATWNSIMYIRPSDHWNRIYIDLSSTAANNQSATAFRPGFRMAWDSTGLPRQGILMDNLKLIRYNK